MLSMLVAYDAAGEVVATLDYVVQYDETKPDRPPLGLVDFETQEIAGASLSEVWNVSNAVGSGTWPEWLGTQALGFRVELRPGPQGGTPKIRALVHKQSGHRRERAAINAEMARRLADSTERDSRGLPVVHVSDLLGSPEKPLRLDDNGRNAKPVVVNRPNLPLIAVTP